jgi:hypothetical protein
MNVAAGDRSWPVASPITGVAGGGLGIRWFGHLLDA